jgi:hypothetical protein
MKSTCQVKSDAGSVPSTASVADPLNETVAPALYLALMTGELMEADGAVWPTVTWAVAVPVAVPSFTVSVAV